MHVTKRIDLGLLQRELIAASIAVSALGHQGTDTDGDVYTYTAGGDIVDLPVEAEPVVAAHVAPPRLVEYARTVAVDAIVRTTDATLTEVFRLPTEPKQLYRGTFSMMAVDAVSGASKDVEARLSFRQQAGSAVQVGSTVVLSVIEVSAASSWAIQGGGDGTDFVVGVRGAAGRSIDWALTGTIAIYAPEGLAPLPGP